MYLRLQKIDYAENERRWYVLSVQRTLFGEWAVIREWGRIGNDGGQTLASYFDTLPKALEASHALKTRKTRRGYIVQAEQLDLPL